MNFSAQSPMEGSFGEDAASTRVNLDPPFYAHLIDEIGSAYAFEEVWRKGPDLWAFLPGGRSGTVVNPPIPLLPFIANPAYDLNDTTNLTLGTAGNADGTIVRIKASSYTDNQIGQVYLFDHPASQNVVFVYDSVSNTYNVYINNVLVACVKGCDITITPPTYYTGYSASGNLLVPCCPAPWPNTVHAVYTDNGLQGSTCLGYTGLTVVLTFSNTADPLSPYAWFGTYSAGGHTGTLTLSCIKQLALGSSGGWSLKSTSDTGSNQGSVPDPGWSCNPINMNFSGIFAATPCGGHWAVMA